MANELTIDNLPDEVLEYIFSKLTLPELKTVRLVCKQWLKVSNSWSITRNEHISILFKDQYHLKTPRGCLNMDINSCDSLSSDLKFHDEFSAVHGSSIRSLTVRTYGYLSQIIHSIINHFCNVEHLLLDSSRGSPDGVYYAYDEDNFVVKDAKLESLLSLTLDSIPLEFLIGPAFLRLAQSVPNLKRLELHLYFPTADPIMLLIEKQALTLRELDITGFSFVTDSFLELFFEVIGPQLIGLFLNGLDLDNIDFLTDHADKLPNLKKLDLLEVVRDRDVGTSMSKLVRFTKLEFLSIYQSSFLDEDILPLAALKNLKGLDIGDIFMETTDPRSFKCFGIETLPNLTAIKMHRFSCLTDDVLATIMPLLPNLKYIDLTYCRQITSVGLSAIFANCRRLFHLVLEECSGIDSIAHYTPNLKVLDLGDCNITSEGVQQIVISCPNLTHLSFGKHHKSANPVEVEPVVFNNLKSLVYLDLSFFMSSGFLNVDNLRFDFLKFLVVKCFSVDEEKYDDLFKNSGRLERVFLESDVLERGNFGVIKRMRSCRWDPFYFSIFDLK